MDPATVIDVGEADFEREVLRRSHEIPVVADFWAPWCGPCRTLAPRLERLAAEHAGELVLARVNSDEAPETSRAFGVRSIPTVIGFADGEPVAQFVGAQPESAIREFFARLVPTPADLLAREGDAALSRDDLPAAEQSYRGALSLESHHPGALIGLARVLSDSGDIAGGLALLERVTGPPAVEEAANRLAAELRVQSDGDGDASELRARVDEDPASAAARLALGRALAASRDYEGALTELVESVKREPGLEEGAARKAMLDIFSLLGPGDPLTERFRQALARALYR